MSALDDDTVLFVTGDHGMNNNVRTILTSDSIHIHDRVTTVAIRILRQAQLYSSTQNDTTPSRSQVIELMLAFKLLRVVGSSIFSFLVLTLCQIGLVAKVL